MVIHDTLIASASVTKKLYSEAKWKRHLLSRQRDELRKRRARKKRRSGVEQPARAPAARLPIRTLEVPRNFSIVNNPDETVGFLQDFAFAARRNNLDLDLRNTVAITTDAIAALIAAIQALGDKRAVRGNEPTDEATRAILIQSGFFDHVPAHYSPSHEPVGRISRQESVLVEPAVAANLIHVGTRAVYGEQRYCRPTFRTLIESMSNTHNHAAGKRTQYGARTTWYATVFGDTRRGRVCFSFLDTGVGIFRSIRLKPLRRIYRRLGMDNNAEILKDILHGKIESSTGIPYRGKGLPSIYQLSQQGLIQSLVIISNDAYANVERSEFRTLRRSFSGTLLYWEV